MHDLPLSAEDRRTLLTAVAELPPRDRLLAELVFGHGLTVAEALSIRAGETTWGVDTVDLVVHRPRGARRIVTASRGPAEAMLGDRRHGPLFATASAVPIRADYASRLLTRLAEQAGVGKIKARRGRPRTAAVGR